MDRGAEIDRLYGLPLDEFVSARGALAKELRGEGDREAAEAVTSLRKPTMGAWAINQVVRRRPSERDKLLAAGEKLRAAHEDVLAGGDAGALRDAMAAERKLAGALADAAEAIATETGKAGPALKERVRGTLHAAALDAEVRDELAAGRVVREREAAGLGPFGAAAAAAPARGAGTRGGRKPERARTKREQAKQERAAREEAERERARELAAAERALASAHAALGKAEAAHEEATGELDALKRAVRKADKAEREARAARRDREKEVAKREREVERLR
jgi:hypothetical protein